MEIPPQDSEAYLLYLRGRYYLDKQTTSDVRTSIDYFQQPLARNPNFARACAGLADAYISSGQPWIGVLPPRQALQEAKSAAENAIRLSSDLSEAHVSLAHVLVLHDWDWPRAEEEYQRAIALDPNSARANNLYSELLQVQGRTEEAVREAERAGQLDPANLDGCLGSVTSPLGVKGLAAYNSAYICPTMWALICVHQELDSVQIQSAMANSPTNSNPFLASGRKKFNLNLRSQGQIRDGEQAHPDVAEIDAKSIHLGRSSEYLHRGVEQLALPATPVLFGVAFENHLVHQ